MEKKSPNVIVIAVLALLIGLAGGFWYGGKSGFNKGYSKAEADIKKTQEEASKKASEAAAKAANPFSVGNPLEGVDTNPFEKVKKVLNPFQ